MDGRDKNAVLIFGGLSLLIFIISLLFMYVPRRQWVRRILFFPLRSSSALSGEERFLPPKKGLEESVQLLMEELILGPAVPEHKRILPKEVRIRSVIFRDGELHLDFSKEIIVEENTVPHDLNEMIVAIGNTVLFNFPKIQKLFMFVNGQLVDDRYENGVSFFPQSLK